MKCAILYNESIYIIEHDVEATLNALADKWESIVAEMYTLNFTTYVAIYRNNLGIPLNATASQERTYVSITYGAKPLENDKFNAALKESIKQFNDSRISYPDPLDWFTNAGCIVWKVDRVVKVVSE